MFDKGSVLFTVPVPNSDSNEHWQHTLNTLERELAAYRNATSALSGATEEERAGAAARVAAAVRGVQVVPTPSGGADLTNNLPPIYQPGPTPMLDPSSSSDTLSSSERGESAGKQIGRGALMIVAAPLAATGMVIYASGLAIEGIAIMLKGMGAIGKKPLKGVMKSKKRSRQ